MSSNNRLIYFFAWLLGVPALEKKVEHIRTEQEEMKGDLRQTRQKADSLKKLVETMRRKEDWF